MSNLVRFRYLFIALALFLVSGAAFAQFDTKWMAVGSLHNWYSSVGCEIEHGLYPSQQYGMRWPAIYEYQDMQAAKGFWIGAKNFTDPDGTEWDHRVVHAGPRVNGALEFFPVEFKMVSKFAPPEVYVDGIYTEGEAITDNDEVDPTIKADRIIINVTNTLLGITMKRTIMQFSQEYHDNYHIIEYEFTNTGNTDDDEEIELPNQTVEDVYFLYQYRWAVCRETRYIFGNGTGWGMNTMIDTRGDGVKTDPPGEQFRAQFAWHGNFPPFTRWDNIGGPILDPTDSAGYVDLADTTGRLGAAQFVGVATLHADTSPGDKSDDPGQPSTTGYESSDDPLTSNNDAFNAGKMAREYEWMTAGHKAPRHADMIETDGDFTEQTGDPAKGTPGGYSALNGYGPYTLGPGESVRLVLVEAAAGLSREKCIEIGAQFKRGEITAQEKNAWVMTSRDSLFKTFRMAQANFESGYNIPHPPKPPSMFTVNGRGDGIEMAWEVFDDNTPSINAFEIYRSRGEYDSTATLVYTADPDERDFIDRDLNRGVSYYYYILSVGDAAENTGTAMTPVVPLRSSRYYTQAYDPTTLKREPGENVSDFRVVPNPFSLGADPNRLRFPGEPDKIGFFNIPGNCTINIYTENGELIYTIEHIDGTGDAYWRCVTSSNQIVVSGVYVAVVKDNITGDTDVEKFVIIR